MRIPFTKAAVIIVAAAVLLSFTALWAQESPERTNSGVINQKAAAIRCADPKLVADEIDAVVGLYPLSSGLIGSKGDMRDSLVAAELAYHQGRHPGIPEAAVVRAANRLARLIKAPAWAYTSEREVRRLRAATIAYMPSFIGKEPASRKVLTLPSRLSSQMSPAESVFILSSLVYQKLNNPEWQLTPEEERALWASRHARGYQTISSDGRRSDELTQAISARSMTGVFLSAIWAAGGTISGANVLRGGTSKAPCSHATEVAVVEDQTQWGRAMSASSTSEQRGALMTCGKNYSELARLLVSEPAAGVVRGALAADPALLCEMVSVRLLAGSDAGPFSWEISNAHCCVLGAAGSYDPSVSG